ncbi:hypothetical protein PCK1_001245, partial [Pneumocystis canis]
MDQMLFNFKTCVSTHILRSLSKKSSYHLLNESLKVKYLRFQKNGCQNKTLENNSYQWSEMLSENPYARALISPIRRDVLTDARIPSAFLLKFLACIHPETNKTWILPDGLNHHVIKKVAQSRWVMNKKIYIKWIGKGQWKRMLPDFAPSDAIWRKDMDDFVLTQFRKRIKLELKNIQNDLIDILPHKMSNTLDVAIKQERIKSHNQEFEAFASLIPPKYYCGETSKESWRKRKQTKETARYLKKLKFDPDSQINNDNINVPINEKNISPLFELNSCEKGNDKQNNTQKEKKSSKNGEKISQNIISHTTLKISKDIKNEINHKPLTNEENEKSSTTNKNKDPENDQHIKKQQETQTQKTSNTSDLRAKLVSRIEQLRASRKASKDLIDGSSKNKDSILETRKKREQARQKKKESIPHKTEMHSNISSKHTRDENGIGESENSHLLYGRITFAPEKENEIKSSRKKYQSMDLMGALRHAEAKKRQLSQLSDEKVLCLLYRAFSIETVHSTIMYESLIEEDLGKDHPQWPFTSYGTGKYHPNLISGKDISPEELRAFAYKYMENRDFYGYQHKVEQLSQEIQELRNHIIKNSKKARKIAIDLVNGKSYNHIDTLFFNTFSSRPFTSEFSSFFTQAQTLFATTHSSNTFENTHSSISLFNKDHINFLPFGSNSSNLSSFV